MTWSIKKSIRTKIMVLVSIAMIGLLLVILLSSNFVFSAGFKTLENNSTREKIDVVKNVLQNEIHSIDTSTRDYATWNDTYFFMIDQNQTFADANLISETFKNLEMNFIVLVGTNGTIAFGKEYNITSDELEPLTPGMVSHISLDGLIVSRCIAGNGTTGLIMVDGRPVLIAARPILLSNALGPSEGAFIMGRVMDDTLLSHFENSTGLPIRSFIIGGADLRNEIGDEGLNSLTSNQWTIKAINQSAIGGFALIKDVYNNPAMAIGLTLDRNILAQGSMLEYALLISLIAASLVFGIVTVVLLERTVVSRLSTLRREVSGMDPDSRGELHVSSQGEDEIGGLADNINQMLATIETERKMLFESEARYRSLFDNALEGIAVHEIMTDEAGIPYDYRFLEVNPEFEKFTGLEREKVIGKTVREVLPGIEPNWIERYGRVALTGIPDSFTEHTESLGKFFEVSVYRNAPRQFTTSFNDVTDRKRAEDALLESVQRYELVMDGSSAGLWDSDVINKRIHFSTNWKAMRGYADDEIGDSEDEWISRIHPDDAPRIIAAMKAHLAGKTDVYEAEYRVRRKDGSYIWVLDRGKAIRDSSGKVIRNVGSEIDITERKLAEEALRASENRLARLADQSGTIIWEIDRNGLYTYVGPTSYSVLGYRPGELVGKKFFYDLTPEADRESLKKMVFAKMEKKERFINLENGMQAMDGRDVLVSTNGIPILNNDGSLRGYQGSDMDISKRKHNELALIQANTKLSILNNVTRHDINNQMMVLNGFLELFRQREKDPELARYLSRMSLAAANVQEQIAFMKDYQELGIKSPTWASVGRRITEAFALLHPPGVVLEDLTDEVELLTDPLADKVPYNLVDNSIRHGKKVSRIRMSAEQVGDSMMIVYEDDGVGISAEDRERLFEKGFGKNTGYGLFLIREILAITGITIVENGKVGKGVRFEMLVPPGAWRRGGQ